MKSSISFAILLSLVILQSNAPASLIFFDNDDAGFAAATNQLMYTQVGQTETFEEANAPVGSSTVIGTTLSQATSTSVFPNGLNEPLLFSTSPARNMELFNQFFGTTSTALITGRTAFSNSPADLILQFDHAGPVTAVTFDGVAPFVAEDNIAVIRVNIRQEDNTSTTTLFGGDVLGSRSFGVAVKDGGSPIETVRILFATVGGTLNETRVGVDNVAFFTPVPEPTAFLMFGIAMAGIGIVRRRIVN